MTSAARGYQGMGGCIGCGLPGTLTRSATAVCDKCNELRETIRRIRNFKRAEFILRLILCRYHELKRDDDPYKALLQDEAEHGTSSNSTDKPPDNPAPSKP